MFTKKYDETYVQKLKDYVDRREYIVDAKLCVEMGISRDTLYRWVEKHKEFGELYQVMKQVRIAHVVDGLVNNTMNLGVGKFLLDCFDKVIPYSVQRDLDRKDREVELRLSGDLLDETSEYTLNLIEKESRDTDG